MYFNINASLEDNYSPSDRLQACSLGYSLRSPAASVGPPGSICSHDSSPCGHDS